MKAARTMPVSSKRQVMSLNLSHRVAGVFYAIYGTAALAKLFQFVQAGHSSPTNLAACLILATFVFFGLILALWVETLIVDPKSETFKKGLGPFARVVTGAVSDVRSITIVKNSKSVSDGDAGHVSSSPVLTAQIEWESARPPLELFAIREELGLFQRRSALDRITSKTATIAAAFGRQIEDRSEL